jgi:hypothetical protein
MEYIIVYGVTLKELGASVNYKLREKWECQGGICVIDRPGLGLMYYQAMIK